MGRQQVRWRQAGPGRVPGPERRNAADGCRARRRGFTLFEALLVIALMAVATTMFLVSVESLGRSSPADELEGAFWRATAQARELALSSRRTVELRWDEEGRVFVLAGGGKEARVGIESEADAESFGATFSEEVAANDFILVRGELVTRRAVPAVRFFPDGTCQAFAVELAFGENSRRKVVVDPWTGAEMLSTEEKKGGRS